MTIEIIVKIYMARLIAKNVKKRKTTKESETTLKKNDMK